MFEEIERLLNSLSGEVEAERDQRIVVIVFLILLGLTLAFCIVGICVGICKCCFDCCCRDQSRPVVILNDRSCAGHGIKYEQIKNNEV